MEIRPMKEIFKDIKGYEGIYQVSNLGNVKSLKYGKERILKGGINNSGYKVVSLRNGYNIRTYGAHQLVAEAFLNHTINGYKIVVNHINFNKTDNRVENLEIVTARENNNKKHLKSTSKFVGVCFYKITKKWLSQIVLKKNKVNLGYFEIEEEASDKYQRALKIVQSLNLDNYSFDEIKRKLKNC